MSNQKQEAPKVEQAKPDELKPRAETVAQKKSQERQESAAAQPSRRVVALRNVLYAGKHRAQGTEFDMLEADIAPAREKGKVRFPDEPEPVAAAAAAESPKPEPRREKLKDGQVYVRVVQTLMHKGVPRKSGDVLVMSEYDAGRQKARGLVQVIGSGG